MVGDSSNSFCIDPNHIAPLSQYFTDLTNRTLPSFAFIEAGYGNNDEHPGSGQSILNGQAQVANIVNSFMASPAWKNSVFFLSLRRGRRARTITSRRSPATRTTTPMHLWERSPIFPRSPSIPTVIIRACRRAERRRCIATCASTDPGANPGDAPAVQGFAAQLGFRLPNIIISPFTRRHYVSHTPMDHTAVIKFVENRFIGSSAHLTARDAAQPICWSSSTSPMSLGPRRRLRPLRCRLRRWDTTPAPRPALRLKALARQPGAHSSGKAEVEFGERENDASGPGASRAVQTCAQLYRYIDF